MIEMEAGRLSLIVTLVFFIFLSMLAIAVWFFAKLIVKEEDKHTKEDK